MIRVMGLNDLPWVRRFTSVQSADLIEVFKQNPGLIAIEGAEGKGFLFWQKNGLLVLSGAENANVTREMVKKWIKMVPYAKVTLDLTISNVGWMTMLADLGFTSCFDTIKDEVSFAYGK